MSPSKLTHAITTILVKLASQWVVSLQWTQLDVKSHTRVTWQLVRTAMTYVTILMGEPQPLSMLKQATIFSRQTTLLNLEQRPSDSSSQVRQEAWKIQLRAWSRLKFNWKKKGIVLSAIPNLGYYKNNFNQSKQMWLTSLILVSSRSSSRGRMLQSRLNCWIYLRVVALPLTSKSRETKNNTFHFCSWVEDKLNHSISSFTYDTVNSL